MNSIDTYISNASEITQPILVHLRQVIKTACPTIEEELKWKAPSFELNGNIICSVMAFKGHVNFIITQGKSLSISNDKFESIGAKSNMSGIKGVKKLTDLPADDVIISIVKAAVEYSKSPK
jgi:hypothetical protein